MNADAVRKLCDEQGISQNELARRMGVSNAHMSNVLNGKREAKVSLLKRMCQEFGKKAEELW